MTAVTASIDRRRECDVLCDHCRLPVPTGLVNPLAGHQFCCAGCEAVYEAVTGCGMDDYYRLRDAAGATLVPAQPGEAKFESFDSLGFQQIHVQSAGGLCSVDLFLEGVTCAACLWLIERLPRVVGGVVEARLSLRRATVRVTWQPEKVTLSQIAAVLDRFGYTPHPSRGRAREVAYRTEFRARLVKLGVAGAISGNLMLVGAAMYAGWFGGAGNMAPEYLQLFRIVSLVLGSVCLAWPGSEFFTNAWTACRSRTINLDVPIVLALMAGGLAGTANVFTGRGEVYFDSLSTLVFLLLIGRFLQFRQLRQAESSLDLLLSLMPSNCRVVMEDGQTVDMPAAALTIGSLVEVRPQEFIPADSTITRGRSEVDQALLTGESAHVKVDAGDEVFGGTKNGGGVIWLRVSRVGEESRIGQLMKLLERGLLEKPGIVRFADKVSVWFVLLVSVAALATFVWWARTDLPAAISHAVAMLIVTCPCVLGLATPVTIAMAMGQLARRDVLVKSGSVLERLACGGRLILDKTGTLTTGQMTVVDFVGCPEVWPSISEIERRSNHPVAIALARHRIESERTNGSQSRWDVTERGDGGVSATSPEGAVLIGNRSFLERNGVCGNGAAWGEEIETAEREHEAAGHTVVLVAMDGRTCALIALRDELRSGTGEAIEHLRAAGFRPEICSGDAQGAVDRVASQLGVALVLARGGVSPEGKLSVLRESAGMGVVMVGDGVNDAAALAAAGVGIAVQGGAEAALAAADVYIARPGLEPLIDLVDTARRTMRVIRGNFAISLSYNVLAGGLAACGFMNPLVAAILMPLSSATVLSVAAFAMRGRRSGKNQSGGIR